MTSRPRLDLDAARAAFEHAVDMRLALVRDMRRRDGAASGRGAPSVENSSALIRDGSTPAATSAVRAVLDHAERAAQEIGVDVRRRNDRPARGARPARRRSGR